MRLALFVRLAICLLPCVCSISIFAQPAPDPFAVGASNESDQQG
jgi:hypothetical protein